MKRDLRIKHYGVNEKGTIIFFLGKYKYHRYYHSILQSLARSGYLVLAIPHHLKNIHETLNKTFNNLKVEVKEVVLMSHGKGDDTIYRFARHTFLNVLRMIIISPTRSVIHFQDISTLVLWGDKFKPGTALAIFRLAHHREHYHFIGYPNVSRYLFAGVGYSQYHDRYENRPKKFFFDVEKYSHLENDVLEDITLFIDQNKVKEKLAIFCENYLPFNSGVNILTNVLKVELEKEGKKVYPVTLKLKGVNYEDTRQDKNVIAFKSHKLPGKNSQKEALYVNFNFGGMMRRLRAYQFTYIQLQTEFTMGIVGMMLRKRDNIPMMYTAHTMWNDMMNKRYPKFIAKIVNFVLNKFLLPPLKFADLMTVPTEKVKKYYMEKWKKKEPIVVIPGCVDGARFILNEEDEVTLNKIKESYQLNDKIVIGYIGRVSKEKSIDEVIRYFEKLAPEMDNLVLMIVGDGPYFDKVLEKSRKSVYGDRMIIIGGVPNDTLKYYYRLFDAFCTASTFETQGLTYVESMWCKIPILARYDECLDHFLSNGVNGITYTNYEEWKTGLLRIISDKEYVNGLVEEGYKTALTYAKDVWAKRMYFLYTQAKLFNEGKITEVDYKTFKRIK